MTLLAGPIKVDLAERRVNAGHTLRSLARELRISPTTVSNAECGAPVTPAVARSIAGFHGLLVSDVWPLDPPSCRRAGCDHPAVRAGWCAAHHEQQLDIARDAEQEAA